MPYLAVDKDSTEIISRFKPKREKNEWDSDGGYIISLPPGSIYKLTKLILNWKDEPIELVT